jgi:hypothetical protein
MKRRGRSYSDSGIERFASSLPFINAVRAVLRLDPIEEFRPHADDVGYHDAWPAPPDGCRRVGPSVRA